MPSSAARGDIAFLTAALVIHLAPLSAAAWLMADSSRDISSQIVVLAPLAAAVALGQLLLAYATGRAKMTGLTLRARGGWALAAPIWLIVGAMFLGTALQGGASPKLTTALLVTIAIALAAFNEEFTFRGAVLGVALTRLSTAWAIGISAVTFGAAHLIGQIAAYDPDVAIRQFVAASLFGVALALVRIRMPPLWPLVAVHAAWNLAVISAGDVVGINDAGAAGTALRVLGVAMLAIAVSIALAKLTRHATAVRASRGSG